MNSSLSRSSFLSTGSLLVLAACSGGAQLPNAGKIADPNAKLYDQMRAFGIAAFAQNGLSVVLPEFSNRQFFTNVKTPQCGEPLAHSRSSQACNTTGGGLSGGLMVIATVSCTNPGSSATLTIGALDYSFTNVQGTNLQSVLSSGYVGPVYATTPPMPKSCVGETITAIAAAANAAVQIAQYIIKNGAAVASLSEWAAWLVAGEVTAAEFLGVLTAVLAGPELVGLLAATGVVLTIGAIFEYIKCESGS